MTDHSSIPSRPLTRLTRTKFGVERDDSNRWFVIDLDTPHRYRLPIPYASMELAESMMDRANAIYEGEPNHVITDLRGDADFIRSKR